MNKALSLLAILVALSAVVAEDLQLVWQDNLNAPTNVTHYTVYQALGSTNLTNFVKLGITTNKYFLVQKQLTNMSWYVTANNAVMESGPSEILTTNLTPVLPPKTLPPTNLRLIQ